MTPESTFHQFVAQVIEGCRVPNIVPYAALYLLASSARSCHCGRSAAGDSPPFEDDDEPTRRPSAFSHHLSKTFHRSPYSRVRKPHWVGHHLFVGSLLVALRMHWARVNGPVMSDMTGFSLDELDELETAMSSCMDEDTRVVMEWMIREGVFRSLKDVECPVVAMRRVRLAQREKDCHPHGRSHHLRRLFSVGRVGERPDSLISSSSTSSSVKVVPQPF